MPGYYRPTVRIRLPKAIKLEERGMVTGFRGSINSALIRLLGAFLGLKPVLARRTFPTYFRC